MSIGLVFWVLMLIWLVFGAWSSWPGGPHIWGPNLLLFALLLLLGWHSFGAPIR